MAHEPEYLRRLREEQERQKRAGSDDKGQGGGLSLPEQEAVRWARETARTDLRSLKALPGARYALLLRVTSAAGTQYHSLEGLGSRSALLARLRPGAGMGEEVVGAYEVRGGRPLAWEMVKDEIRLKPGVPRPGAHPVDPEKMIRQAQKMAAKRGADRSERSRR